MRKLRTAVLVGLATLGIAGAAMAAGNDDHPVNVNLPNGSVEHVQYRGNTAPTLILVEPPLRLVPVQFVDTLDLSPFALLDQVFANLDSHAAAMIHRVETFPLSPHSGQPALDWANAGNLPEGTVSYHFVSTSDGNRVCSRSWQVTSKGNAQQPKLVSATSGDCGAEAFGTAAEQAPPAESSSMQHRDSAVSMV
ncbi:MAG TPA: hypothetical protein VF637_04550 [Sphingomicrobium sp.]